jgi:hypothetical protein
MRAFIGPASDQVTDAVAAIHQAAVRAVHETELGLGSEDALEAG